MARLQDIAELLVASWVLSGAEGNAPEPLPAPHGILDRALQQAMDAGAFPEDWAQRLHFVDSRVGLKCVELQAVIDVAQQAEFTSEPNPSYKATRIKIGSRAARALLRRHGNITEEMAMRWGALLHEAVEQTRTAQDQFLEELSASG